MICVKIRWLHKGVHSIGLPNRHPPSCTIIRFHWRLAQSSSPVCILWSLLYDDDCFYYHSWRNNVVTKWSYAASLLCLAHHAVRLWCSPIPWSRGAINSVQIHWDCPLFFSSFQRRWPSLIRRNRSTTLCNSQHTAYNRGGDLKLAYCTTPAPHCTAL